MALAPPSVIPSFHILVSGAYVTRHAKRAVRSKFSNCFLARLLILIQKGGLSQLNFGVVGVGINIYLWAR